MIQRWAPAGLLLLLRLAAPARPPGHQGDTASHTITYNGDVNIGVLVDLHHSPPNASSPGCGQVNVDAVQQVLAAKWAVDVINNQSLPHELKIGLQIHDTCSSHELGQAQLFQLISTVQGRQGNHSPRLIGLIGMVDPPALLTASAALNAFHVPVVAVTPGFYSSVGGRHRQNILTTAPDLAGQARALVNIGAEVGARRIALISSSQSTVASFLSESTTLGIRVPEILELIPHQVNIGPAVEGFLRSLRRQRPVVAMVLDAADVVSVAEHLRHTSDLPRHPVWLIGTLGLELRRLKSWRSVYRGGAFVEPHMPELREFRDFFLAALQRPEAGLRRLTEEYMVENTGCVASGPGPGARDGPPGGRAVGCGAIQRGEMEVRFQQDPQVSFVVKAVSALTAAFRLVQLDSCGQAVEAACLRQLSPGLHHGILANLHKLSFTSMGGSAAHQGSTKHHFTKGGRLVANKQIVYSIGEEDGLQPIGWYSEDEGLTLSPASPLRAGSTGPTAPRSSPLVREGGRSSYSRSIGDQSLSLEAEEAEELELALEREEERLAIMAVTYESFIGRTWALVTVSVALFGICLSLWMLVYVFLKMCDGTLTGNQSMGVLLLLGVILMFGSAVPWLLPPSAAICAVRHFFHPLAFCLCFGLLLIKVMQLRSLVSVGLGGTIPQVNQLLSLFFIVMVQVVITTEWYVINMPLGTKVAGGSPECDVSEGTFLLLHLYPALLLLLTLLYGIAVFRIKRNFNEGRWVTCATVCIIPVFAAWALVYYFGPPSLHDPSVAVAIVTVAGVLVTTIFFPKMHTISQQSKYRKLKLHSPGSDSTVYTSYTTQDYPSYSMYYPPAAALYPASAGYHPRPHLRVPAHPGPPPPHLSRFNGLNYLANPFHPNATTTYADWSREHTPGYHQAHHQAQHHHHQAQQNHWKKMVSINPHHIPGSGHPAGRHSRTPEDTLASSKRSSKVPSPEALQRQAAKKSALKQQQQQQQQQHGGLLLGPSGLPVTTEYYDKNSRVYHLTP